MTAKVVRLKIKDLREMSMESCQLCVAFASRFVSAASRAESSRRAKILRPRLV